MYNGVVYESLIVDYKSKEFDINQELFNRPSNCTLLIAKYFANGLHKSLNTARAISIFVLSLESVLMISMLFYTFSNRK